MSEHMYNDWISGADKTSIEIGSLGENSLCLDKVQNYERKEEMGSNKPRKDDLTRLNKTWLQK